jgi:hypothetical protein
MAINSIKPGTQDLKTKRLPSKEILTRNTSGEGWGLKDTIKWS